MSLLANNSLEKKMDNTVLEQKIYALLGFSQKAGKMVSGDDTVVLAMGKGKIKLLIIAEDLSENSWKKFQQKTRNFKKKNGEAVEIIKFGTKETLGGAIGKSPRGILGIADEGFGKALNKYYQEMNNMEKNSTEMNNMEMN